MREERKGEEESKGEREKRRRGESAGGVVAVYKAIFPMELPTEINCCQCN
jgi:hypothetical protein